jgi:arylsulfatase A-like enzyme
MATMRRNILFIMCDQLRADYLSCYGHPYLNTPHIDRLAARGVRFTRAYAQSSICGPSRMSAYTGRYVRSHGATWNGVPLRVGEPTLGDHLRELGMSVVVIGKTHMAADWEGMRRLGISPHSPAGVLVAQCGFEPYERDDGLHPGVFDHENVGYAAYLRQHGFHAANPWEEWANSAEGEDGQILSGWFLSHSNRPARVPEEHSETAYSTRRAIDFIREAESSSRPWCLHLSLIKPHWPYIAPAPYHRSFGPEHVLPPARSDEERRNAHPLHAAFMEERVARAFAREDVRKRVIPAYMGLVKQIDDRIGRLLQFLHDRRLIENTMVVFTSDHGDYLGDHWLGEKQLLHDASVRVPMIVYDPSPEANGTRSLASDALVEMIDLAPTFLDFLEADAKPHILEGRSLIPLLRGEAAHPWRPVAISEYDYAFDRARQRLRTPALASMLYMVTDGHWKLVHADGFRPMLFDLRTDPQELRDIGADPDYAEICARLDDELFAWFRRPGSRITISEQTIKSGDFAALAYDRDIDDGILIGYWDEDELEREFEKRNRYLL